MIVDCHTHIGTRRHFEERFVADMLRSWGGMKWPEDDRGAHWEAMPAWRADVCEEAPWRPFDSRPSD